MTFLYSSDRRIFRPAILVSISSLTIVFVSANLPDAATVAVAQEVERQVTGEHPLDRALERADEGLKLIEETVTDYTATIIKRERINGKLKEHEFIEAKIRNRKEKDGKVVVPFAVYLKFLKPASVKGREVIWVENSNENKVIAHETGLLGFKRFHLPPDGFLAMMGQRYPITNIGFQNLIEELLVRGEQDRKFDECEVKFYKGAKVDKYVCTLIEVTHPIQRDHFLFYRARIYIDESLGVPIRYAAWSWSEEPGGKPLLEEEYTYRNIKLNVGLTDKDFDPDNEAYDYP